MDTAAPSSQSYAKVSNVRGLVQMLQAIKSTAKQHCTVVIGAEGLSVRWEIDSKTLQSSIFLKPEMFLEFHSPGNTRVFGLQFNHLIDTLQVFASSGHELVLKYPNANMQLECQMSEQGEGNVVNMYAQLDSQEMPIPKDLSDYWQDPSSSFLIPDILFTQAACTGFFQTTTYCAHCHMQYHAKAHTAGMLLKEMIEDLEWTAIGSNSSTVEVCMHRQPHRLLFTAQAAGSLQIEFPTGDLGGFSCTDAEVRFSYKYKNLRTALFNIPQRDTTGVNSKVSIDAQGLMKITHMVNLQHIMDQDSYLGPSAYSESQVDYSKTGIISFMMVAEDVNADDGAD